MFARYFFFASAISYIPVGGHPFDFNELMFRTRMKNKRRKMSVANSSVLLRDE